MKIEVEVISEETIKPSSRTPPHLRHHHLSFLDQLAPHTYASFIYFYSLPDNNLTQISTHLKNSLSKTLTHYYPLAGRVRFNLFVDCNDLGIPFSEARVKSHSLSDVIANPSLSELNNLLPSKPDELTDVPLGSVQLNLFPCGGVAIGCCVSHRIADALSYFMLVRNWAAVARGNECVTPDFSAASIFPPKNVEGYNGIPITKRNPIISKRFVFDGSKIEALRAKYGETVRLKIKRRPSRVEALSAFSWGRFMAAAAKEEEEAGSRRLYAAVYIMDLRSRFDPPLPQSSFGNYYRAATATPTLVGGEESSGALVREVIEEIEKIDNKYMRKFQDGYKEHLDFIKKRMEKGANGELVTVTFSSLCRFPIYEAGFGWGKPVWVNMASMKISNQIFFMDTKMDDGIESYFFFKEEDMAKFELDSESSLR